MVQTRSQIARLNSEKILTEAPFNNKTIPSNTNTIYRNFVITDAKYKVNVDNFYMDIEEISKHNSILKNFWSIQKIENLPFSIEYSEELLLKLIDDEPLWKKFENTIQEYVVPHETFLKTDEIQEQMKDGKTRFVYRNARGIEVLVDLTPLLEFRYWLKFTTMLFIYVQKHHLDECDRTTNKKTKINIAKKIFQNNLAAIRLIRHKYAFTGLRFYITQVRKLIEFFNEGLDFTLYAFGEYFPEMITDEYYPYMNKENPNSKIIDCISEDDPYYGEAKKKYQKYY